MIRIGVADDEQLARYNLIYILKENFTDISFIESENGQQLIQLIQNGLIDIALVDIRMPKLDGLEAMERCKDLRPIPWAIVSSYAEFPYAKRALTLGALGYILKPPDPLEVKNITAMLINKWREIKKIEIKQLESFWIRLLQNHEKPIHSENQGLDHLPSIIRYTKKSQLYPLVISLQGPSIPQDSVIQTIKNNYLCYNNDEFPLFIYPDWENGLYESLCSFSEPVSLSVFKESVLTHLIARLQHDYQTYIIKIITGLPCFNFEIAREQIFKIKDVLKYEPLLPNSCLDLETSTELLLPFTAQELEASKKIVSVIQSWRKKDWLAYKSHILDLFITLEKVEPQLQIKLLHYLERIMVISLGLSAQGLSDKAIHTFKENLLSMVRYNGNSQREEPFTEIIRFIDSHSMESISITQVASLFGFSPNYLSTLFHQKTGETFTSYITKRRIQEARNLLRSGLSVKEAAWAVGYADEQHFSKLYKKIMGYPPVFEKKS
ncbi:helix-turn-helix domain-containing protein [Gracilinema caldarium]|uniref:response regulator transcription factor n=1 Tax=Gracilinema caldarium TaxID=215591 RepID=UPI0026F1970A|nr:helix-turn-helix domain-containing protein [Gracilinema caldarium]